MPFTTTFPAAEESCGAEKPSCGKQPFQTKCCASATAQQLMNALVYTLLNTRLHQYIVLHMHTSLEVYPSIDRSKREAPDKVCYVPVLCTSVVYCVAVLYVVYRYCVS